MLMLLPRIRRWLVELNVFESGSTEIEVVQHERWSSRVNIVLLLTILCSLAIYTGLENQTTYVTVKNPSYDRFLSLQLTYPAALQCPCSNIAIKYEVFTQLQTSYHQVCSSSFVNETWIMASYGANASSIWPMDARTIASAHAQFLRSFCTLNQLTISQITIDSLGSLLVSPQVLSSTLLELKVNDQLAIIQSTAPWLLTATLLIIKLSTTGNQMISGLGTNSFTYMSPDAMNMASIDINTYETMPGSTCSCFPTIECQIPAAIYSNPMEQTLDVYHLNANSTAIKGMQAGCFPLEGFLSSTLECYFDSSCLQLLVPNSTIFTPLNSTQTSRFLPNTTVQTLINELLVEEWFFNFSPKDYYDQCAPSACTYSYNHRNTLLTIITTLITIFSGLNTVLRMIIPRFLEWLFKMKQKCSRQYGNSSQTAITWAEPVAEAGTGISKEKLLWLWTQIKSLNLFNSYSTDPLVTRREQQTTRSYIILLSLAFLILLFYISLTRQTNTYTIYRPTQAIYQNLQSKYAETIECPCTNVAIAYQLFITITPRFHQVCSSEFISPIFIAQLYAFNKTNVHRADFMAMSGNYFTWIASWCTLYQVVAFNLYDTFKNNLFVNVNVLPQNVFENQADSIMQVFINTAPNTAGRALTDLLELTGVSQPLSVSYTAFDLDVTSNGSIRIDPAGFSNCSCLLNPKTCSTEAGFYSYDPSNNSFTLLSTVMGIRVACLPIQSNLQSSLACWYSADCYQEVIEYWRNRTYALNYIPQLLVSTKPSRYNTSSLLFSLTEQQMIEDWTQSADYVSFYEQCEPSYCTYSVNERPNIIFIITALLGVFSGLNVVLKLLVPIAVRALYWCFGYVHGHRNVFRQLKELPRQLIALNLFYNRRKSSVLTVKKELRATRLYVLLFSSIFIILLLFNTVEQEIITVNVQQPTQTTYEQLSLSFGSSLQCPCSQISIPYRSFIEISPTLHQICSSAFVQTAWIESIFGDGDWSNVPINEFGIRGVAYFLVLQSLCTLANGQISSAIPYFLDQQIISGQVIPKNELLSQITSDIDQLQRSFSTDLVSLTQYARDSTQGNQLMTVYSLNWVFSPRYDINMSNYIIPTQPISHGRNCSCSTSSACTEPIFVSGQIISGFVLGCFPLESLLRSSLICLYNQTCLNLINIANLSTIHPLDDSLSSRFPPNMTVDTIVASIFIEEWSSNVSFSTFFAQCQPSSCSYSVSQRRDVLKIITILLGLYGGLTMVLHFITPVLIFVSSKIAEKFKRHNNVVTPFN